MASKLSESIDACKQASAAAGGNVLVALSGGKDSLAVLDLCKKTFDHVEAFYLYLVDGLECVERHLFAIAKRYDVKVHKVPHPILAKTLRTSTFMPAWDGTYERAGTVSFSDMEALARKRAGIEWTAYGERVNDSIERRAKIEKVGMVHESTRRVYPIAFWKEREVYAYLQAHKIPLPVRLGNGKTSGFGLSGEILTFLKREWPADFKRVLEVYPFAEALVYREEHIKR